MNKKKYLITRSLGCGIAFGYLHRIPIRRRYPPAVPDAEPLLSEQAKENLDPTLPVAQPATNVRFRSKALFPKNLTWNFFYKNIWITESIFK